MLDIGLLYIAFTVLRYAPSIPGLSRLSWRSVAHSFWCCWDRFSPFLVSPGFCHEGVLDVVKRICHIAWDEHVISVLVSVYVIYYICWFSYLCHPCMFRMIKLDQNSWLFLCVLEFSFQVLTIFASMLNSEMGGLLFWHAFIWFFYQGNTGLIK